MREKLVFELRKNMPAKQGESIRVPHSFSELYLEAEMPEDLTGLCYIVVKDEKNRIRLQKMFGHGERNFVIGQSGMDTTTGGIPGSVAPGEWKITLYFHMDYLNQYLKEEQVVPISLFWGDEGKKATETIGEDLWINYDSNRVFCTDSGWFKGDFHTHTRLSDGKETTAGATKKALDMGLDFYVPTEHNGTHTGWKATNLMIVPGIEMTTEMGHCNFFGIDEIPSQLENVLEHPEGTEAFESLQDAVNEAKEKGWLVSINHPFLHIWKWLYHKLPLAQIDCMEIINDPTYQYAKDANDKAIEFLFLLWQEGYPVTGIGGSDSHNLIEERYPGATEPSVAGDPATLVYCDKLTPKNLLNSVRQGHVIVTRHCEIEVKIWGDEKEYLPGDQLTFREGKKECMLSYGIVFYQLTEKPKVFLVHDGTKEEIRVVERENSYEAYVMLPVSGEEYHWIGCEARDKEGNFLAYVNPVYTGNKEREIFTFGEAVSRLEQKEKKNEYQGNSI